MTSAFLAFSVQIALVLLSASFLLTVIKVIKGPTLPDRVLALDMLVAIAIGYIAVLGIKTGYTLYLDIAIALGLVGFLATIAFSRFILMRGLSEEGQDGKDAVTGGEVAPQKTASQTAPKSKKTATKRAKSPQKAKS